MARFEIVRTADIAAPRERVHALVDDFHDWSRWSPWEDVDPALRRSYSGADRGVGARYGWEGNRQAGRGSMEILESTPERIRIDLRFEKPIKARHELEHGFADHPDGTRVTWTMRGENRGLHALFWRLFPMERELGKQFEQGLAKLRAAAEG
ncbi:SRPBCC family protein [Agrococcus terreus]|nr:SRPBCC family protein [Agrococcus terreus]